MRSKPEIAIVGPGRLGSALARELTAGGYRITEVICRGGAASLRKARALAKVVHARAVKIDRASLDAHVVWFCVPDRDISPVARVLINAVSWRGKIAFHSSGALSGDALAVLRKRGAAVAAVHPVMTFVHESVPSLQ